MRHDDFDPEMPDDDDVVDDSLVDERFEREREDYFDRLRRSSGRIGDIPTGPSDDPQRPPSPWDNESSWRGPVMFMIAWGIAALTLIVLLSRGNRFAIWVINSGGTAIAIALVVFFLLRATRR